MPAPDPPLARRAHISRRTFPFCPTASRISEQPSNRLSRCLQRTTATNQRPIRKVHSRSILLLVPQSEDPYQILLSRRGIGAKSAPHQISPFRISHAPPPPHPLHLPIAKAAVVDIWPHGPGGPLSTQTTPCVRQMCNTVQGSRLKPKPPPPASQCKADSVRVLYSVCRQPEVGAYMRITHGSICSRSPGTGNQQTTVHTDQQITDAHEIVEHPNQEEDANATCKNHHSVDGYGPRAVAGRVLARALCMRATLGVSASVCHIMAADRRKGGLCAFVAHPVDRASHRP